MKLVICEKNISARRIAYILSNGKIKSTRLGKIPLYEFTRNNETWRIIGLKGHIINLDFPTGYNKWNKVTPAELINVDPIKKVSEKSIASALKSLVENSPYLIVATDFDREGELIGVEIIDLLKTYNTNLNQIKRAKFSAITNQEIESAFKDLTEVDYNLSNAGETRQVIDLIWGAVLTRFISLATHRFGRDFLSIGRVQSPTLALIVEREKEIKNFEPKKYWKIIAKLKKDISFDATHAKDQFWNEEKVKKIYDRVKTTKTAKVKKVEKKINREFPPSPFNTTTFLEAASHLGVSAARAMSVAEELYMSGLISYPRTDNTVYPPSLNIRSILEKLKNSKFSKEALEVISNGRNKPTRGKKQATDHPPIHPVGIITNQKLTRDHLRIYELICRRFLSTLAKDAISEIVNAFFDVSGEDFKADGYRLIESNWLSIYTYYKEKRKILPELLEGELVNISKINLKEDYTKPPPRYTQGSLIAKMEKLLLGTKSTRHEIISKLYSRKYITLSPLAPTPTAFAVIDSLEDCDVVKPVMTAKLENDMDQISEGKKTLEEIVDESKKMLSKVVFSLEKEKEKIKKSIKNASRVENTIGKCPKCGNDMIVRTSKRGKRFVGCSSYPKCNNTYSLPQFGGIFATGQTCEKCSGPVVKIKSKDKRGWELCLNSECNAKKPKSKKN
ncbi:MAG: DNA topoisomerase I [Thermoplasmatales archaeon]|nr:MAG: DNA topoisomerase I [Thermoplasmatales archaeon]